MRPIVAENQQKPEYLYKYEANSAVRQRLKEAVVSEYRPHVARLVRRFVPARHWREAEQVGAIGVLVALEKFDPERGAPFWALARQWVRDEINRWIDSTLRCRSRGHDPRVRRYHEEEIKRVPFDEGNTGFNLEESAEDHIAELEAMSLLQSFLATLTDEEKKLLLTERRTPGHGGRPKKNGEKATPADNRKKEIGHSLLVERARAFVRGPNE